MCHAGRLERRPPVTISVGGELEVPALALHPAGDEADTGPRVEPSVDRPSLRRSRREQNERKGGGEQRPTPVRHGSVAPGFAAQEFHGAQWIGAQRWSERARASEVAGLRSFRGGCITSRQQQALGSWSSTSVEV